MDQNTLLPLPRHPRRPGRVEKKQFIDLTAYRAGAESQVQSQMLDFSPTGVGLLHPLRMDLGEQFSITLTQPGGLRIKLLYNTIYCNENKESGGYHVGGEFICAVSADA